MAQRRQYWKEKIENPIKTENEIMKLQIAYLRKELNTIIKKKETSETIIRTFDKEGNKKPEIETIHCLDE